MKWKRKDPESSSTAYGRKLAPPNYSQLDVTEAL